MACLKGALISNNANLRCGFPSIQCSNFPPFSLSLGAMRDATHRGRYLLSILLRLMYRQMKSNMSALKVVVFMGSVRQGRNGERVLKMVTNKLKKYEVTLLDAKELEGKGFPLVKQPLHFYGPNVSAAPEELRRLNEKVKEADAFVFITAEYNSTCPPGLLNLIDHFPPASFAFRPSSIISYSMGPFGGIRAATALRSILSEIGTISSQAQCTIPTVTKALSEDGSPIDESGQRVEKNIDKVIRYLEWYAEAIKDKMAKTPVPT